MSHGGATTAPYAAATFDPPAAIRWNGWWFLAAVAPIVALVVAARLFSVRVHVDVDFRAPLSAVLALILYAWSLAVVVVASRRRGLGSLRADFGWNIRPIDLLYAIAAVIGALIVGMVLGPIARSLGSVSSNIHLSGNHVWDVVAVFFIPTLVAAPIEELLYRGLLMRWIRIWLIRHGVGRRADGTASGLPVHVSVVASAILFALGHLYEVAGPASVFNLEAHTLVLGLVNGYLATRTGRLGPAVVTHGLLNLIAAVAVLTG